MRGNSQSMIGYEDSGLWASWTRFWFAPSDTFRLHLVRVLTGLLLLWWLLPLMGNVSELYGLNGWFDRRAYVEANRLEAGALPKPLGWSVLYLAGQNDQLLHGIYWGSIATLVLFTLGIATRLTAIATWVIVVSFTANPLYDNEVDPLLQLLTLYVAFGYLLLGLGSGKLKWYEWILGSRDSFLLGRVFQREDHAASTSVAVQVALRLLQVHFAILIVTTGMHKLQIGEWWSGVAHWFNVYPPLETTLARAREHARDAQSFLSLLTISAYSMLVWQLTFPVFAWRSGWLARLLLLGGAIVGWVGLTRLYSMPLVGPAVAICCLAFLSSQEWANVGQFLKGISPLKRLAALLPERTEDSWSETPAGPLQPTRER